MARVSACTLSRPYFQESKFARIGQTSAVTDIGDQITKGASRATIALEGSLRLLYRTPES